MPQRRVYRAVKQAFQSTPKNRTILPAPNQQQSPWYYTAGPTFSPGADGAILNSKLSKAWQVIYGVGYRVANPQKYSALQPSPLYAPKGVPVVGINIQLGSEGVITPAVNDDGTFADEGIFQYDASTGGTLTAEGEW